MGIKYHKRFTVITRRQMHLTRDQKLRQNKFIVRHISNLKYLAKLSNERTKIKTKIYFDKYRK